MIGNSPATVQLFKGKRLQVARRFPAASEIAKGSLRSWTRLRIVIRILITHGNVLASSVPDRPGAHDPNGDRVLPKRHPSAG
jgi:hypothetical protein